MRIGVREMGEAGCPYSLVMRLSLVDVEVMENGCISLPLLPIIRSFGVFLPPLGRKDEDLRRPSEFDCPEDKLIGLLDLFDGDFDDEAEMAAAEIAAATANLSAIICW